MLRTAEHGGGIFGGIFATRDMLPMFVVLLFSQVAAGALGPIVAPYVRSMLGDSPFVSTMAGAAIAVTGIAGLASSPLLGRRSDKVGYRGILLISILGTAVFTLPQAFAVGTTPPKNTPTPERSKMNIPIEVANACGSVKIAVPRIEISKIPR